MNRELDFEKTIQLYENLKTEPDLKCKQQYFYALIHKNLIENSKKKIEVGTKDNPIQIVTKSRNINMYAILLGIILGGVYSVYLIRNFPFRPLKLAEKSNVKFEDVRGLAECKEELEEIVNMLKNRTKYIEIGAKMPRGILLTGPPGTGKTLLAKAIAGEAGVNFFNSSGSEFEEVFVGMGAKRIRDLFASAKAESPSIIFIDEIDAVGGSRKLKRSLNINRQSLNQLLVEMDGFSDRENVIVIAATNLPESLDEALKRPGRFDKVIDIPKPDMKSRKDILDYYLSKVKYDATVDSNEIAKSTTGLTGADLFNLVNMSMLSAVKSGRLECNAHDIETAKDRIFLGVANKSNIFTPEEKFNIALNEAGHVLAILYTEGSESLYKTSILRRGDQYSQTSQVSQNDRVSMTRTEASAFIDVKLAGKIMEELIQPPDKISTQSEKDIMIATENAHRFIRTGMFNEYSGLGYYENKDDMGPEIKNKVDASVNILLQQSYARVKNLLKDKIEIALAIAKELVEKETLTKNEILDIVKNFKG